MEGGEFTTKPVPLPRRTNKNVLNSSQLLDPDLSRSPSPVPSVGSVSSEFQLEPKAQTRQNSVVGNYENNNIVVNPIGSTAMPSSSSSKPVPLPRKLYQRFTQSSSTEKRKSKSSSSESGSASGSNSGSVSPTFENEPVPDGVKRGTINLFKRTIDNPFDNDFESSIKGAELLRAISFTSPLEDLDETTRARFSTLSSVSANTSRSSGSEDCDHYMEPKSSKRVPILPPGKPKQPSNVFLPSESEEDNKEPKYSNDKVRENKKRILEKVMSCPPAGSSSPIANSFSPLNESSSKALTASQNESLYETISSYSSSNSDSNSNFGLDPFTPMNPNASQLNLPVSKRMTVPNVDKSANGASSFDPNSFDVYNINNDSREIGLNRFGVSSERKSSKERFSFSEGSPTISKHSSVISDEGSGGGVGAAAAVGGGTFTIGNVILDKVNHVSVQKNVSNRSTVTLESVTNSKTTTSCRGSSKTTTTTKKVHEYDEVAIEDGTLVFREHSNFNSIETTMTNNNSCSSLTSRNSVVQEFDPLFEPEKKSSPIDLLEDPLHRYEYIDVDVEDGVLNSTDSVQIIPSPPPAPPRFVEFKFSLVNPSSGYVNPEYFPVAKKNDGPASGLFLEQNESGHVNLAHTCNSHSGKNSSESASDVEDQEYEPIGPPTSEISPETVLSNTKKSTKGNSSGKMLSRLSDSSLGDVSAIQEESGNDLTDSNPSLVIPSSTSCSNGSNAATGGNAVSKSHTDVVNQSNFFRRLSHKIRLNVIKEEKDSSKTGKDSDSLCTNPGPQCRKCLEEHPENSKCKFVPTPRENIVYSTHLYKPAGLSKKDFSKKWAVLSKGKLTFYNEKSEMGQEVLLDKVVVVSKKHDQRLNNSLPELKCFEMGFCHSKPSNLVLAGVTEGERCAWMQKYIEAFTHVFPAQIISNYERGGWCFIKENVTSNWHPSWLILKDRTLHYANNNGQTQYEIDLRKTRSIALSQKDGEQKSPFVDNHEVLTLDLICKIIYIQTESSKVTTAWEKHIHAVALQNGPQFHEMQLTMDNVPVIVDKCIDFLYAHGTLAEGIYRQSGSNTRITQLLADFQKDAWSVQISNKEFSAHDVAGTLKRFFRTLPEPLVTLKLYNEWSRVAAEITDRTSKLKEYTRLLDELPEINYNIMKKLICHLYAVHELHEKNLMPLVNLAPIWGPTLMNVDVSPKTSKLAQSYEIACAECEVVKDLIENYYTLFRVDPQEIAREKKMQDALESFHLTSKRKCSGDMKMWIYIWEQDETTAINITLTPSFTAHTIVQQLCATMNYASHENVALHEVICQNALERPLHPSEKVIETVLRWSIWDVDERKNNFLILKKNVLYTELVQHAKEAKPVSGELKYADSKSKSFRKYAFQFSQAMLKYSKDFKSSSELGSWKIEDIVWYMGCEPKRTPPTRWTCTFVTKKYPFKRSKEEPFFGNVLSYSSEEELHVWIGAMVLGEHPEGLYPSIIV